MNKDIIIERMITRAMGDQGIPKEDARRIAEHMTCWLDELYHLVRFYNDPKDFEEEYVTRVLDEFLTNVPRHLDQARLLYHKTRNPAG